MPWSISTARFTVSMLSNSITGSISSLCSRKDLVDRLARRDIRVETDELLRRQLLHLDVRAFRQRMTRRHDEHQMIVAERQHLDLPLLDWEGHETEVHRVVQNVLVDEVRAAVFDAHIDRRVIVQEFLNERRQLVQPIE